MGITASDFDYVCRVVRDGAAISMETGKEYLVEMRMAGLARRLKMGSATEVIEKLRSNSDPKIRGLVIEAMTTNETSFFRDSHPFEALRKLILPELIKGRSADRRLSIWCAACSSGQEPYSIAMLVRDHFPELLNWQFKILATDLSEAILAQARSGRFSQLEVNRGLPAPLLVKHFRADGSEWVIQEPIRKMIDFQILNLIDPWPSMPPMDLVFIRNVMIYFPQETKKMILGRISRVLRPTGFLFLGAAETTLNLDNSYERVPFDKTVCYRAGSV
jgi:chemotaxis protein methyltransferase CheR